MRGGLRSIAAAVALAAGVAGAGPQPLSAAADGASSFRDSAVVGGGFISVLGQSNGTLIAGGDTEGFFRSTDGAQTWTPQNSGLAAPGYHVAAIVAVGGTWYAAVGDGNAGGIAVSGDDGITWNMTAHAGPGSPSVFDGSNLPGSMGHPRATGQLLASDGTYLYAATFGQGLQRWAFATANVATGWTCVSSCTTYTNAVALDGSGDAFLSTISRSGKSGPVYEVHNISGTASTTRISSTSGVSVGVQEVTYIGKRLYSAGAHGIGYWDGAHWSTLDSSAGWYTLQGYETSGGAGTEDVLYAAAYQGRGSHDVEELTAVLGGVTTIAPLVPPGSVGTSIYGTTAPWWMSTSAGRAGSNFGPSAMVGGCPSSASNLCAGSTADSYVASNVLEVAGSAPGVDALLVAGRSGVWRYDPSATPSWLPAVEGMNVTFASDVATDPTNAGNVAIADIDWKVLGSIDSLGTVDAAMTQPAAAISLAVAWDTSVSPSALIVSGGSRTGNSQGGIWYNASWSSGGAWMSIPLPTGVKSRPIALSARATGSNSYVLLAAFQKTGVYAFAGAGASGVWTEVQPTPTGGGPTVSPNDVHGFDIVWAADGSAAYAYDSGTHAVWWSAFNGASFAAWSRLYIDTSASAGRGWVVGDPGSPAIVWVANEQGLGSIDTSACTSACPPTWIVSSSGSSGVGGPLAAYTGPAVDSVYMAGGGVQPTFWKVEVTNCVSVCAATAITDPFYVRAAASGDSMAVGADGTVYLGTLGNGVLVGTNL